MRPFIVPHATWAFGPLCFAFAASVPSMQGTREFSRPPVVADSLPKTTLVILGADHSAELADPSYHPGYFRAFLDRVRPAAICVERSPDEFARNDYYEFTYEAQYIAVPYAREHGLPVCPIDWLPSRDDERLAFGRLEVVDPPPIRPARGFQSFLVIDSASFRRSLFYADSEPDRAAARAWYDQPRAAGRRDFPRRLGLYRTFMQAMRIRAAALAHRGQTVLVVVGSMHKDDIEHILGGDPAITIVQPSSFGLPSLADAARALTTTDLAAIASFNLLGVQPAEGPVDWAWVDSTLQRFERASGATPEVQLLRTRYGVLTKHLSPAQAVATYEHIARTAPPDERFTFTGVADERRLDSYYDPFGNLSVRERALVEIARESAMVRETSRVAALRAQLLSEAVHTELARSELMVYWDRYITPGG